MPLMQRLRNLSLKNKIFFSTTAVILLISVLIAVFTRWVLISSLTSELKRRGLGIAQSIAESSRGYILTENNPELTSLLFDARLGERRQLVVYAFIQDEQGHILSHTFVTPLPPGLNRINTIPDEAMNSIRLLRIDDTSIYDVAVPVIEGIYRVGSVHVGLAKRHIDQLIGKLRTTFLGFLSVVTVIFFGISHRLSQYITRPITELTTLSDEISRGHFERIPVTAAENRCWEIRQCGQSDCPAYGNEQSPCWFVDETLGSGDVIRFPEKLVDCHKCPVHRRGIRDEVQQLTDSFINMTNRIRISQLQMKESEEKYRSLFAGGPNPIFVVDRDSLAILDANPATETIYGYRRDELIGMRFTDLGEFADAEPDWWRRDKQNWLVPELVSAKVQFLKKNREPIYVNVHASQARYQDRDAMIIATADITEIVEKDSQLIQASKMTTLGEMSAGIAHELNQPLNAIKMGSEYLQMMAENNQETDIEDLHQVVSTVSEQVDRAAEIIVRLRDFGRKADFTRESLSVNKPIRSVIKIVERQLGLQNIVLDVDLDDAVPPILAHHNRMEQVVFNLITNARDAINQRHDAGADKDPRCIRIRSFKDNGRVAVSVGDTGIGIPESLKQRIFEAFFTTKEMGEGMGLGLSITYGIVQDYDGNIDVESTEGEGTTFSLRFPPA